MVPNKQPIFTDLPYRIAIVGEAPGRDEEIVGEPFVGESGRLLNGLLGKAQIVRDACFVGNVCQHRPENNQLTNFEWDGPEIQGGMTQLKKDLEIFKPNILLLLGGASLHAFKNPTTIPKKKKSPDGIVFNFPNSISSWRGSLFRAESESPYPNGKCLSSYHPAACLMHRRYEWRYPLLFDIKKTRANAETPLLSLPQRDLRTNPSPEDTINDLKKVLFSKPFLSIDIEGGIGTMSCLSIATSPTYSFIVPFSKMDGSSFYDSENTEIEIWSLLSTILEDPSIPKVFQNGLYDTFVLQYSYNITVRGVVDDTMLKHWERFCEWEKSLGFQASLYTDEPYYKSDRKTDDREVFWRYCCRDSAITFEINRTLDQWLTGESLAHYRFNVDLLSALRYMELKGIRYNTKEAKRRLKEINSQIYRFQFELDTLAGVGFKPSMPRDEMLTKVRGIMCQKRNQDIPLKAFEDVYDDVVGIISKPTPLTTEDIGFLNVATEKSMNIKSPIFKTYLYDVLKLPVQLSDEGKPTTDYNALLKLSKKSDHKAILLAVEIGSLRTRSQMLAIHADPDGRIRCGYNLVGSKTGRITSYTSPTGSGYNLQTIPDDWTLYPAEHPLRTGMRNLFLADEGYYFFQCDLKGSDGWTIGAWLNKLGDSTMLDDLRFGIKPAARICYLLRHGLQSLKGKDRSEIRHLLKEISKEDWDYFALKIGIWGMCYLMGPDLLANEILEESNGKVQYSRKEMVDFKEIVFSTYRIKLWHDYMSHKIGQSPELTSASGHKRRFYGRPREILGEALSDEPQNNTTYATKKGLWNLWFDQENRIHCGTMAGLSSGNLRIQPLHTVHDSLCGQFRIEDTTWAVGKIKSYFDNPLMIAGQKITIPFDGAYGLDWALDKKSKVGEI